MQKSKLYINLRHTQVLDRGILVTDVNICTDDHQGCKTAEWIHEILIFLHQICSQSMACGFITQNVKNQSLTQVSQLYVHISFCLKVIRSWLNLCTGGHGHVICMPDHDISGITYKCYLSAPVYYLVFLSLKLCKTF